MIPIENITEQELEARFSSLPEALQEALDSEQNLKIVNNICENNLLLDKERKLMIQQVAALTLLGYIHPDKLALELEQEIGLNHKVAAGIAENLNSRIFSNLKNEIEKVYAPLASEKIESAKATEIKSAQPVAETPSQPKTVPIKTPETITPPPKTFIDLSSLNKTKQSTQVPPMPKNLGPYPFTQSPTIKTPEFKPTASVYEIKTPPKPLSATPPVPAPIFLKKKPEVEPLKTQTNIRIESKSQFDALKGGVPQPPKPARLEIGKSPSSGTPSETPKMPKIETAPPRVVNYSQWQTPTTQIQPPKPISETSGNAARGEAIGSIQPENKSEALSFSKPLSTPPPPKPEISPLNSSSSSSKPPTPPAPLSKNN